MRRIKHWFRHEWEWDRNPYDGPRFRSDRCVYPDCTATCLYDRWEHVRFGYRK